MEKSQAPVNVISVTGGKGGVGKTNIVTNLAVGLANMGERVLIFDADLSLANVDILFNIHAEKNISHVLTGECSLRDVLVEGPMGIKIIPGSSGIQKMADLSMQEYISLIYAFSELVNEIDVLLIDTASGISKQVISYSHAAQDIIIVLCNEPTSLTDAYATIKLLTEQYKVRRFRVLANMVGHTNEGYELFMKLCNVTDRFLKVQLQYIGEVPYDQKLRKAVRERTPVLIGYPEAKSSLAFKKLAQKVAAWPPTGYIEEAGRVSFFLDHLLANQKPLQEEE